MLRTCSSRVCTGQQGRQLAEDGLVLAEQLDAAREGNAERLEELAALRRQVRVSLRGGGGGGGGWGVGGGGWVRVGRG